MSLEIKGIRFEHEDFVLGPLDLELPDSRRTALIGPSGCGKTSLLRIVAGLEHPTAGRLVYRGSDLTRVTPSRRGVAMVFQNLALWPHMTALAQVRYAGDCSESDARRWLDRVGLGDKEARLPGQLSGGEASRVALARALAQEPRLLLLDEPLRSADPHLRDDLQHLIRELTDETGTTTILVTHDRDEALAIGEHIVVMRDGHIVECGAPQDLLRSPRQGFTATFFGNASLLRLRRDGDRLIGPLGTFDAPPDRGVAEPLCLALIPGDVVETDADGVVGKLLHVVPDAHGARGDVELEGQRIRVRLAGPRPIGEVVRVRLEGEPRIVAADGERGP